MDDEFAIGVVGIHPNDITATVWLRSEDFVRIVREQGNEVCLVKIPGKRGDSR